MERRFFLAVGLAVSLAIGCGERGAGTPAGLPVSDPGGDSEGSPPELPAPPATPDPTPTATPVVIAAHWETQSALYLTPPADGVLRPVAELECVATGWCQDIVLIGCSGSTLRVGERVAGENRCRSLPGSSATLEEFTVLTDGLFDPTTNQMAMRGTAVVADGFAYEYSVTVELSPDGATLAGTGTVAAGWPLVITGTRLD